MPSTSSQGRENFWYSYDYGNVHWISISSEHSMTEDSEQMQWLMNDVVLASKNRQNVPWIVLSMHRPIYCSSFNSFKDTRPGSKYQTALEPLLLEYDVDLTITGECSSSWVSVLIMEVCLLSLFVYTVPYTYCVL